jgi:predicted metal-dependent RNase
LIAARNDSIIHLLGGRRAPAGFPRFDFTFDQWLQNCSAAIKGSDGFVIMSAGGSTTFVPTLRFLGAAGTVTGSKFLITASDSSLLIDCGLFQGTKEQRLHNWDRLPVKPDVINSVILTHAHLDHSGYLTALCRDGFKGRVFSTPGTYSLCRILLPDSGHLQEEEADYANRKGYSKHAPALPLYTEAEAWKSLEHFSPVSFNVPFDTDSCRVTFRFAGHILGASLVLVETGESLNRRILFSGQFAHFHGERFKPETRWRSGVNSNCRFRPLNSQTIAGGFVRRHPDERYWQVGGK